jgi:hypothetical protein
MPGATSKRIFKEAGLPDVSKTTRNHILGKLCSIMNMIKRPSLTPRHKRLWIEWSRKKKIIVMHDNALSHAAKATTQFLHSLGFVNETLMVWTPNSQDLNPIENLWSIIKRHVYANGKHYSSKDDLWMAISSHHS